MEDTNEMEGISNLNNGQQSQTPNSCTKIPMINSQVAYDCNSEMPKLVKKISVAYNCRQKVATAKLGHLHYQRCVRHGRGLI